MKTQEQVLDRVQAKVDPLGFQADALLDFLDYDHAKPLLKEGVEPKEWPGKVPTRKAVIDTMRDYMEFAWGKAQDHRGISASRSVEKFEAWLWLLGDEDALREFQSAGYENYGAPKLAVVCRRYDFPIPEGDDLANMIEGRSCEPGCMEGCGG